MIQDLFVNDLVAAKVLPDHVIVANQDSDNILTGSLLHHGYVLDFHYDSANRKILLQENRQDSDFVTEYVSGMLDASGIRCDSNNPYEWLQGYLLEERFDFIGQIKCDPGNIPCGGTCLPRGKACRIAKGKAIIEKRKNKAINREISMRKHPNAKTAGDYIKNEIKERLSGASNRERAEHIASLRKEVTEELNNKLETQKQKEIDKITRKVKHQGKLPGIGAIQEVTERLTTSPEEIFKREAPHREKATAIQKLREEKRAERVGGGILTSLSKAKEAIAGALRKKKAS